VSWLKDILTEDDNNSVYDPVRMIGCSGFVALVVGAGWVAVTKGTFDALNFASGVAAIAAAVGVGAGVKAKLGA
jgi:hypothetical protein